MASILKLRRGNSVSHSGFTGAQGEVTFNTDTKELVAHDGTTVGGFPANLGKVSVKRWPQTQAGFEEAVAFAYAAGAELNWPAGNYVSTGNIPNFHNVQHTGTGRIQRGGATWYITPSDDQTNTLYFGTSLTSAEVNDGLSPDFPARTSKLNTLVQGIGGKSAQGKWVLRFNEGTITDSGVRFTNWPVFKNTLEISGPPVASKTQPLAIWDGTTSAEAYAIRAENTCIKLNLTIKNIEFRNFNNATDNSGAIILWNDGLYNVDNLWVKNCPFGISIRYGYIRILNSNFVDCATGGAFVTYGATGNVGNLVGGGNTFTRCQTAVDVGRHGICYIQGNTFTDCAYGIYATRLSRYRAQANTFVSWTAAAMYNAWGLFTPDNEAGYPNTFTQLPTASAPVYVGHDASHLDYQKGAKKGRHATSNGDLLLIENVSGIQTLLSSVDGSWSPFRLPGYALYNNDWRMSVELNAILNSGAGGEFALYGAGTSVSSKIAAITIAPGGYSRCKIYIDVHPSSTSGNTVRYNVKIPELNLSVFGTTDISSSGVREANEIIKIFRLYWTPSSAVAATFFNMHSYFEG